MAAAAADGQREERPVVIEIAGVAGAGKSTLAANLAAVLSTLGYAAEDSRSTRRGPHPFGRRLSARLRAFPECARATAFVVGRIARRDLPLAALSRLGPAYQHSRQLRLLVGKLGAAGIVVQEPGWLMDLLTQYVHAKRPLTPKTARRYVEAGPRVDFAVILRAGPEAALRHMRARKRGLPKSFRKLDAAALTALLRQGDRCSATIADACRAVGIDTIEIDVDLLDGDAVTARCTDFLAAPLARRLGASEVQAIRRDRF
ncbi:MAG: hypothetical protein KIT43_01070 [Bauldia sp.]|nr:hypothetical protein [Bauldia sp.]